MPFDFMPLETGYVVRLHGDVDRTVVISVALTALEHFEGSARWVLTDIRDADPDSIAAMAADVQHVRDMDRQTRGIGRDQIDVALKVAYVCSAETFERVVPPMLAALDDIAGTSAGLDSVVPRFDTLAEGFAWDAVTHDGPLPPWVATLDAAHDG